MSTTPSPQAQVSCGSPGGGRPSGARAGRARPAPRSRAPGRSPACPTSPCRRSPPSCRRRLRSSRAPRQASAPGGSRSRARPRAAEHRREPCRVAGEAGADHVRAERPARARTRARRWPAPPTWRSWPPRARDGRAPRSASATCSSVAHSGLEVRAPEVDGLEPEPAHRAEQLVEALGVGLERRERLVRRPVAVAPAVHRPAGLAGDEVRGHEGDHSVRR